MRDEVKDSERICREDKKGTNLGYGVAITNICNAREQ